MKKDEGDIITIRVDGHNLNISYPRKLYWPKAGITKISTIDYYEKVAGFMLPYFKNRPATLHCFPRGIAGVQFYRKDFKSTDQEFFDTFEYQEVSKNKMLHVPIINSRAGLLWMVNKGCFEFHLWSAVIPNLAYPDMLIFDLDVHKDVPFKKVLEAALILKDTLRKNGLKSYPKTSGGTGLHIYVPVIPDFTFTEVRKKLYAFIEKLVRKYPLIFDIPKRNKTHTGDKITIDINQNVISRNTAAPYTVRAFPGAPVSAPLSWEEVEQGGFIPADFHMGNIPERLARKGDVFSGVLTEKQALHL